MTDGHGDDLHRYPGAVRLNFSSNIARVDNSALKRHIAAFVDAVDHYPEPTPVRLERVIASRLGVDASRVLVTAGTTDAIYLIAARFAGKSTIVEPTFAEYEDGCGAAGCELDFIGSLNEYCGQSCMVWLCNPNNPTGSVIPADEVMRVASAWPDTLFVVDEAYADYVPGFAGLPALLPHNIITLHSMTKRYSVPGLRVGYLLGSPTVVGDLRQAVRPWAISTMALEGGLFLERGAAVPSERAVTLHSEARRISVAFMDMGLDVLPTAANFLLAELPRATAAELKEWLVANHGILIRDASNFRGLTPRHFRVAASEYPEENNQLINAVSQWLQQYS